MKVFLQIVTGWFVFERDAGVVGGRNPKIVHHCKHIVVLCFEICVKVIVDCTGKAKLENRLKMFIVVGERVEEHKSQKLYERWVNVN